MIPLVVLRTTASGTCPTGKSLLTWLANIRQALARERDAPDHGDFPVLHLISIAGVEHEDVAQPPALLCEALAAVR